jgi:hypothetical protein
MATQNLDAENGDLVKEISDAKHSETVSAGDLLAQYSDAEKAKAFRKLDWNLIPLFGP